MGLSNIELLQTQDGDVNQLQVNIKKVLNPLISNAILGGQFIGPFNLTVGTNTINHGLGQALQGWWLVSPQGVSNIYQAQGSANIAQVLILNSSVAVTVSLYVF